MEEDGKPAAIRALLESPGWQIIDQWLTDKDNEITEAIKTRLINLKWSEKDKWFPYYSGEATMIYNLRDYINKLKKREERKDRVEEFKKTTGFERFFKDS